MTWNDNLVCCLTDKLERGWQKLDRAHPPFYGSCFLSCRVTCHLPHQRNAGGGVGLVTGNPTMRQVVLGYNVTSSRH